MKKLILLISLCLGYTFLKAQIANDDVINNNISDGLSSYTGTIQECNKAIELTPKNAEAYLNRGVAKCKIHHYGDAISDYNRAIEIDPKNAEAYCLRGLAKHFLEDNDGACLDWKNAVEFGFANASINIKEYCQ